MRREHLCIFGMGDCGSTVTIKEFNETVNENLTQTMISKVRQTSGAATGTQAITFKNIRCDGDINIGNISQKMVVTYDFKRIMETTDETQFKNMIKNAVVQGANASTKTKAEFMGPGAPSNANVETTNRNVTKVVDSYTYNDFTNDVNQAIAAQEMNFIDLRGKNCNFENISQDINLQMFISQMSDQVTRRFSDLVSENEAKQKGEGTAESESQGVFSGVGTLVESVGTMVGNIFSAPILLILGIILFVVMIGMVIKLFSGGGSSDPAIAAAILAQQSAEFEQYEPIPDEALQGENQEPLAPSVEVGDLSTEEGPP